MTPLELHNNLTFYGKTQEQFARDLVISVSTVNRWLNAKSKPSPLALKRIKEVLLDYETQRQAQEDALDQPAARQMP